MAFDSSFASIAGMATSYTDHQCMMLNDNDERLIEEDMLAIYLCNGDDSLYMSNIVSIMLNIEIVEGI
jgi:hypothetical protein